jgi:hypothetical protein
MECSTPPIVPEKPVPVLSVEQLRELLDQCKGRELLPLATPPSSGCCSTPGGGPVRLPATKKGG